jgi:Gas vesicle protein
MRNDIEVGRPRTSGLVEVLDRVLDKGLFIGGDVKISLAEVELLTIRIRLIVCSLDKARDIGLDWWTYDRHLAPGKVAAADREALEARLLAIEELLAAMPKSGNGGARSANGVAKSTKTAARPGAARAARKTSSRRS